MIFIKSLYFFTMLFLVAGHDCILHNNNTKEKKSDLFDKITDLKKSFQVDTDSYVYAVSVCSNFSKQPYAAVVKTQLPHHSNQKEIVLGRYNDTDVVGNDHGILLTFGHGDFITDNSSCKGSRWTSLIWIDCEQEDKLELLSENAPGCLAIFHLSSPSFCPQQGTSVLAKFFYTLLVLLAMYFALGIIYRRFFLGAKGYEQVPNYTFWKSFLTLPIELVRKVLMGNSRQRSAPQEPLNTDPADEPLLSP